MSPPAGGSHFAKCLWCKSHIHEHQTIETLIYKEKTTKENEYSPRRRRGAKKKLSTLAVKYREAPHSGKILKMNA